ncbi:type II toxin-antitoxin system VapB family antitoxin [Inquilinus limosus]|uniref:type II toxin-antitoxin system VapB family antitoxin n=1 Tax=Inquilinus limosus TaxID=171674 RepID=UPI003F17C271
MAFFIKDEATEAAVRRLAKLKQKSLAETIREAGQNEYLRMTETASLVDRLRAIGDRYAAYPKTGLKADKAFFDDQGGSL